VQQESDIRKDEALRSAFRGTNAVGVRDHNERLVLTLVRRHGPLPKAQIARLSGLSAQTVSVIVRALEADGLLARGDPIRGKVGQPSVPIDINPDGAYFFGLKIGRRSAELALVDFQGQVFSRSRLTYRYPSPLGVLRFVEDGIRQLVGQLDPGQSGRVAGLGIAMPFQIWEWARVIGLSPDAMEAGARPTSAPRSRRSAPGPSTSRTMPPRPAGRNWSSARRPPRRLPLRLRGLLRRRRRGPAQQPLHRPVGERRRAGLDARAVSRRARRPAHRTRLALGARG
jgi:hypothetical protein